MPFFLSASKTLLRTAHQLRVASFRFQSTIKMEEVFRPLGLSSTDVNAGVFYGKWCGNGEVVQSVSPIDNSPLGRVSQVRKSI